MFTESRGQVTVACQSMQIEQFEQDLPAKTMHITPWHLNEHKVSL